MKTSLTAFFLILSTVLPAQNKLDSLFHDLCYSRDSIIIEGENNRVWSSAKFPCHNNSFVNIIKGGKENILPLINMFDDSTKTNIFHSCKGDYLNRNELSAVLLQEIVDIPYVQILHTQLCLWTPCTGSEAMFYYFKRFPLQKCKESFIAYYSTRTYKEPRKDTTSNYSICPTTLPTYQRLRVANNDFILGQMDSLSQEKLAQRLRLAVREHSAERINDIIADSVYVLGRFLQRDDFIKDFKKIINPKSRNEMLTESRHRVYHTRRFEKINCHVNLYKADYDACQFTFLKIGEEWRLTTVFN